MRYFVLVALLIAVCAGTKDARWVERPQSGKIPEARGAHTLDVVGDVAVLFGGFYECFDAGNCEHTWWNNTYHYDLSGSDGKWTEICLFEDERPEPRGFHSTFVYEREESLILYGGVIYNAAFTSFKVYGDMWSYSPAARTWTKVVARNAGPGPRVGPAIAIHRDTLYLFGGLDQFFGSKNDLWTFNLKTGFWSQVIPDGAAGSPAGRYLSKYELEGDKMYIFSGNLNPSALGVQIRDAWVYSISSNSWSEIFLPAEVPSKVHGASAITNKGFFLFLGDTNDDLNECKVNEISGGQNPTSRSEFYDIKKGTWTADIQIKDSPNLKRIAGAQDGREAIIWGGYDFECAETPCADGYRCFNTETSIPHWSTKMYSVDLRDLQ